MPEQNKKKVIAAFDFDGTLTTRDSLLQFLFYTSGTQRTLFAILKSSLTLLGTCLGLASRQEAKEALIASLYKGIYKKDLLSLGEAFASTQLNQILRPIMIQRLKWHQEQGHTCILVSANLDVYLNAWSEQNGFSATICSRLATDHEGRITGKLDSPNCWGPEKKRRLFEWLSDIPRDSYILYAYGDSRGDQELLSSADFALTPTCISQNPS